MREALLHIGAAKAGSSSLQGFLAENRAALTAAGAHYSHAPNALNHISLAAYAWGGFEPSRLMRRLKVASAEDYQRFEQSLSAQIAEEAAEGSASKIIFSSELLHSRVTTEEQIARLAGLMAQIAEKTRVIFYIRRQDRAAVSRYSTLIVGGESHDFSFPILSPLERHFYDYANVAQLWRRCFDDVSVRVLEADQLLGGDLITDFLSWAGVEHTPQMTPPTLRNRSLSAKALEFLSQMNTRVPHRGPNGVNPDHTRLVEALAQLEGPKLKPARAQAEAFTAQFAASNETLRQDLGLQRASLFDMSFEEYPETAPPHALSAQEAIDIAARIWPHSAPGGAANG